MSDQYELKDIRCFLSIARAGSISRAAATYNIPKATLSHHLRRLEDALHVELFVRKAKGRSSRKIQQEFEHIRKRYWGHRFWQRGYFSTTSGNITDDIIMRYLDRHTHKDGFSPAA